MPKAQQDKLLPHPLLFDEALRQEGESFRLLVESVSDYAIFMLDVEGHILSWNAGAQRLNGWRSEEILGRSVTVLHPSDSIARGRPEEELRIAREEGVFREEAWRVRKDGSEYFADVTLTALYDERHQLRGFAKVTRDITERRLAEDALRESEEKVRLLIESIQDYAIFMLNPDGCVASWNAGAERLHGWQSNEIIGQHVSIFHSPEIAAVGSRRRAAHRAREGLIPRGS
jgi:PAS domain S-box-containing protein